MPDLIEEGHLYVAQPPLYRIADGKKEAYIKDDESFHRFLVKRIGEKEWVRVGGGEKISGRRLEDLLRNLLVFYDNVAALSRRGYGERFLEVLGFLGVHHRGQFKDREFMEALMKSLHESGFQVHEIHADEDGRGYYEFTVTEPSNGGRTFTVDWEMLSSPELKRIMGISERLNEWRGAVFVLGGEEDAKHVTNLRELLDHLLERAKKGLSIQRYKGLGEMNPTQLWQTTMDPDKRTLLKVKVEDVVEADEIFSILMGDKVEPRRDFIQTNALEVKELDI
jgi:DNA gyrase subunit B